MWQKSNFFLLSILCTAFFHQQACLKDFHRNEYDKIHFLPIDPNSISFEGAALFSYINSSGLSDDQIFLQVIGTNPKTGNQCFVSYDSQGNATLEDVTHMVDSEKFSYPLSFFSTSAITGQKNLYLPCMLGSRIYTSINKKIEFLIVQNSKDQWTICAPNPLNPDDPNRDTIWDKTEFTISDQDVFINPTAVDDFSLPLVCSIKSTNGVIQQGGISVARSKIFRDLKEEFSSAEGPWMELLSQSPSMVFSPMFAAATGRFPQNLLEENHWIDAFCNLFSKETLKIDMSESFPPSLGGGIWQGLIDPSSKKITFQRDVDATHPVINPVFITLPDNISEIIAGSGPSWQLEQSGPLGAALARNLSCAIDTNTLTTQEPLSMDYFTKKAPYFYQHNSEISDALQFIDHYSKVLHSYGDHKIYTIPYDDELNQSGSASVPPSQFMKGYIQLGPLQ
jgi:hypothetical protein